MLVAILAAVLFTAPGSDTALEPWASKAQPGDVTNHLAGVYNQQYGNYTRWRALGGLNWTAGAWSASWTLRYIGALNVGSANPNENFSADASLPNVVLRIPSVTWPARATIVPRPIPG